jgi:hypothetical protein
VISTIPDELIAAIDRYLLEAQLAGRDRDLRKLERRLAIELADAWRKEGALLVRKLAADRDKYSEFEEARSRRIVITQDELDILYGNVSESMRRVFEKPLQDVAERAFFKGAAAASSSLGGVVSLDLANPRAQAYLVRHGAERVTAISLETRARLRTLLANAIEDGKSYTTLGREIEQLFSGFGAARPQRHVATRAELVAITETGDAYAAGNRELAKQVQQDGQVIEKHWLTAADDRVDDEICAANEEAGWIDLDDPYPSGHMRPLGHPACRCDEAHRAVPAGP